MRYHFIAVGGSIMHNLALAMRAKGNSVSGSDDEIFEPSLSRLRKAGILPDELGWHPERISPDIDAVILGMHARADNPELLKAQELGLKVYSFPEFFYSQNQKQIRIVVGGSHGKTTTTSMIMHCLRTLGKKFNYLVGAQVQDFDLMVDFSEDAQFAVIEGDEYLTSPLDPRSKFLHYHPNVAVITGIAWDHVNVFPTFESYVDTFRKFAQSIETRPDCQCGLIGAAEDPNVRGVAEDTGVDFTPYQPLRYKIDINDQLHVIYNNRTYGIEVFGDHNLSNMHAAMLALQCVGVRPEAFLATMATFKGAQKRLQLIARDPQGLIAYLDFAHSPSKLAASVKAVRDRHSGRLMCAIFELHTFSSLQRGFLTQYKGALDAADEAAVYYNPEELERKRLEPFSPQDVAAAFGTPKLKVITATAELESYIKSLKTAMPGGVVLLMSSGNFGGVDVAALVK